MTTVKVIHRLPSGGASLVTWRGCRTKIHDLCASAFNELSGAAWNYKPTHHAKTRRAESRRYTRRLRKRSCMFTRYVWHEQMFIFVLVITLLVKVAGNLAFFVCVLRSHQLSYQDVIQAVPRFAKSSIDS
jgi:hypothetical protein